MQVGIAPVTERLRAMLIAEDPDDVRADFSLLSHAPDCTVLSRAVQAQWNAQAGHLRSSRNRDPSGSR